MDAFIKWVIVAAAYGTGILFAGGFIYFVFVHPIYSKWADYKRKRDARDLNSYTVLVKEANMQTEAIKSVLKLFNGEVIKKKAIKLDEILSITYSPHAIGHQFTLWYKEERHMTSWWVDFIGELFSGLGNYSYHNTNQNFYKDDFRNNNFFK